MGFLKIFPAAAGIIALTATVSFARDLRECEEGDFCRTMIANRDSSNDAEGASNEQFPVSTDKESGSVYHVEITRGLNTWRVCVDAYTGKILDKRDGYSLPA
ncbi:PepSY domain-containing protein [Sideroxydans sp. CL21]|uniref:PepSY domain-containing protein n=1 Tax=Sideroxydans sp. CL21 TaxID=2600596 RepID=UPI0024BC98A1|nr:PepSY domain-containing protein [Sideroxydans sp. CL21]